MRIRELALSRPRFGYLRIHVLLGREGWKVNRKRVPVIDSKGAGTQRCVGESV